MKSDISNRFPCANYCIKEDKEVDEWKFYTLKELGKRHEMKNMLCQDRCFVRARNHKYIGVLVDGIGTTNLNVIGAEMAAQITAGYIEEKFDWIVTEDSSVVASDYLEYINENLREMADLYNKPIREFASTVMAFCVDESQNRYCALHLGDGIIMYKSNTGQMRVMSFPEIGFYSVRTTLTTTEGAYSRLSIKRGSAESIDQIALMTDGIYRVSPSPQTFEKVFRAVERHIPLEQGIDDQGVVMLCRERIDHKGEK